MLYEEKQAMAMQYILSKVLILVLLENALREFGIIDQNSS